MEATAVDRAVISTVSRSPVPVGTGAGIENCGTPEPISFALSDAGRSGFEAGKTDRKQRTRSIFPAVQVREHALSLLRLLCLARVIRSGNHLPAHLGQQALA